jgi:hypothetical protein
MDGREFTIRPLLIARAPQLLWGGRKLFKPALRGNN